MCRGTREANTLQWLACLQNSAHCTSENHEKQSSLLTETLDFAGLTDYSVPKYIYVGLEDEMPFLTLTDLKYTDDFSLN